MQAVKCAKIQLMHEFYEVYPSHYHIYSKLAGSLYKN